MNILKEEKQYMSNILVTGGAGFIGSHLCEVLLREGHSVTSLDNYFTGSIQNHISGVKYVQGSTLQMNLNKTRHFDIVYHLGEYSRVEQSFNDFQTVWEFNILGTKEVLEYCKINKSKLIYAGSSTKFVNHEDYIQSPYAWSKASNTEFVKKFCEWNNIEYAITYFYNAYGKREIKEGKYATLIAKYKRAMQTDKILPIVLPGTQKRNFTHVDDITNALLLIGMHGLGDEFGIGNPKEYSIEEVADLFGGIKQYLPERKGNRMFADVITEKTEALGWKPLHSLETYIMKLKESEWKDK